MVLGFLVEAPPFHEILPPAVEFLLETADLRGSREEPLTRQANFVGIRLYSKE